MQPVLSKLQVTYYVSEINLLANSLDSCVKSLRCVTVGPRPSAPARLAEYTALFLPIVVSMAGWGPYEDDRYLL